MMLFATAFLQIVFLILAIGASVEGNVAQTVLFCTLIVCEEISGQNQQNRKEARP